MKQTLLLMRDSRIARLILSGLLALGALVLACCLNNDAWGAKSAIAQPALAARTYAPMWTTSGTGNYPNCRFGVAQVRNSVISYGISSLNPGWYLNWGARVNPPQPGGIEYVQMLRTSDGAVYNGHEHPGPLSYSPSGDTLATIIAANPGVLWLVGNEPDCIWQDNVLPQDYAQIYHDAYTFIKGQDPTAQVAVGGIVQPTPLRMEYLGTVLDTYTSLYGEPLPADAWHIHSFILREVSCTAYPDSCWGCEIPPGISADHGMLYELDDTDNLDIFQDRLVQFRQWMGDQGYRDTSLIVTEYGTLLPYYDPDYLYYDSEGKPFDEERARDFMYGTYGFLLTANDQDLGYPADENRLVQRWLWYSLDDTSYGGALFDPYTTEPLTLGIDFGVYTRGISPTVDLLAVNVRQMGPVPFSPVDAVTITLQARVSNIGNVPITESITIRFLDDEEQQIGFDQVVSGTIAGCADSRSVTIVWPNVAPGAHVVRAVIDPSGGIGEANENNNEAYGVVLVAKSQSFLPLITHEK